MKHFQGWQEAEPKEAVTESEELVWDESFAGLLRQTGGHRCQGRLGPGYRGYPPAWRIHFEDVNSSAKLWVFSYSLSSEKPMIFLVMFWGGGGSLGSCDLRRKSVQRHILSRNLFSQAKQRKTLQRETGVGCSLLLGSVLWIFNKEIFTKEGISFFKVFLPMVLRKAHKRGMPKLQCK